MSGSRNTDVGTYAAIDVRVREWFFRLFREKKLLPAFLNATTCLQSTLTSYKGSAKTVLPIFVPTSIEALLLFHEISHVNECMDDKRVDAKKGSETAAGLVLRCR